MGVKQWIIIVQILNLWFVKFLEELASKGSAKRVSKAGVTLFSLPSLDVRPEDRLETRPPGVYTRDLLTLEESPTWLGLMTMDKTTFLGIYYDEADYVIEGRLDVISGDEVMSAGPG